MKAFSLIGDCAEKSKLVRRLVVELVMILAVTSDLPVAADVPCLALPNIGALADFVLANARAPSNA